MADSKISKALEQLVTKRQQQIAYLRRSHLPDLDYSGQQKEMNQYWLNTMKMTPYVLNEVMSKSSKTLGWFCLGMSMSKLLDSNTGPMLVNSFIQLMEEFQYAFGNRIAGGFAYLRAKNLEDKVDVNSNSPIKPVIWKQNNKVVYQFLDIPHCLPDEMDYCLIVYSMTSVLYLLYSKFLDPTCSNEKWRKAIENLDLKISNEILKVLADQITKMTLSMVDEQVLSLMPTLGNDAASKEFITEIQIANDLKAKDMQEQSSGNYQV